MACDSAPEEDAMNRLKGKTALITGAARGLGAAIARRFVEEGASVIINDLSLDAARKTAQTLNGLAFAANVADSKDVAKMFADIRKATPRLDILVNNAGISGLEGRNDNNERLAKFMERAMAISRGEPVEPDNGTIEETDEDWHRMMGVHVDGTFFCCREALKTMTAQRSGAIVNMGSIMGTFGRGGGTAYCTAKAAILGFTRSLAHEVADRNIRVNAIAPGWILTDMTSPFEAMHPMLAAQTPQGRIGEPDDIAWAAVYLASDEAKFMTGQVVSPNGGWYMSQ
jgi:NAD(P)-dependent dehydrogenase (short-subunit alcohol dehydrogenase family)